MASKSAVRGSMAGVVGDFLTIAPRTTGWDALPVDGGIGAGGGGIGASLPIGREFGRTGTGAAAAVVVVTLTLALVASVTGDANDAGVARILSFSPVRRSVFCEKGNDFGASLSSTSGTVVFRSVLVSIIDTGRNRGAAIPVLLPAGSMSSDLKPRTVGCSTVVGLGPKLNRLMLVPMLLTDGTVPLMLTLLTLLPELLLLYGSYKKEGFGSIGGGAWRWATFFLYSTARTIGKRSPGGVTAVVAGLGEVAGSFTTADTGSCCRA